MGACVSALQQGPGAAAPPAAPHGGDPKPNPYAGSVPSTDGSLPAASGGSRVGRHGLGPADLCLSHASAPSATERGGLMLKVHALQQDLAMLSTNPLLALSEAAEVLTDTMAADYVGVAAFCTDETGVMCTVLLASQGSGAAALERHTVMHGGEWAAAHLLDGSMRSHIYIPDVAAATGDIPRDFGLLYREAGLRSCLAVPIGPLGRPFGALLLGRRGPGGFDDQWSAIWPSAAATGLLQQLRPTLVSQAIRVITTMDAAPDPISTISAALQSGAAFLLRSTNMPMGIRLALLDGPDAGTALVFQSTRAQAGASCKDGSGAAPGASRRLSGVLLDPDFAPDVAVRELPLSNTLLESAVLLKKARFVKDCASYLQNCPSPARDVFTHASDPVSSVVVVPLLVGDDVLGAIYFTQDTPCDFVNIQDALLGFVHCVTPVLHSKLAGNMGQLRSTVAQASRRSSRESGSVTSRHALQQLSSSDSEGEGDFDGFASGSASCTTSARLSKVSNRQLCTEAMLRVLQQDIRRSRRRSLELSGLADLVIHSPLGRGGYGNVFAGMWQQAPAAIKVMHARSSNSEAVSDAMEMAVLSSVQHPNIVQVFSCLTDMVYLEDATTESASSCPTPNEMFSPRFPAGASARPRFRRMMPGEELEVPSYNIIVMEYCDRGTLKDAVISGLFHQKLSSGAIGVDLVALVDVLLDVAHSLSYLHRINLLHGDVKLENVLLKSEPTRPFGVVPKLADFGLCKILSEYVVNHNGAGTITHLPPEMLVPGTRVTTAVDVYSFGIMMWEFYTSKAPYAGLTREGIMERVLHRGGRPAFPSGAPRTYVELATACWAASPADRPSFDDIVGRLQEMAGNIEAAVAGAAGAPA